MLKLIRVENALRLAVYFDGCRDPGRFVKFTMEMTVAEFLESLGLPHQNYELIVESTSEVVEHDALLCTAV